MMQRAYNFNAGPAALPLPVLEQIRDELLNWHGTGASIMELSHRGPEFAQIVEETEQDLRDLMGIPQHYRVLFMQGGGRAQYEMIPLNLLSETNRQADYVVTGLWSQLAASEARRYGTINIATDNASLDFSQITEPATWRINPDAVYLHYVDNETVHGLEFPFVPDVNVPLVCDMTSNILSRPVDVNRYGMIYAAAQKNMGIAGMMVAIIREDLIKKPLPSTPVLYHYQTYAQSKSLYNTPATFVWYVMGLVLKWLRNQGGIQAIEEINQRKAQKLYDFIDRCEFYQNKVAKPFRSRMSVPIFLKEPALTDLFIKQAKEAGMIGLAGHRTLGGIRIALFNAIPEEAVDCLIAFMAEFADIHGRAYA